MYLEVVLRLKSIPKRKFKSLGQVYDLWYNKTGNVAKEIVMGKEKEMA